MDRRTVVQISYDQTFIYQCFYWVVSMADAVARLINTVLCAVALNQGTLCQYHNKLAKHRLPCFSNLTHSSYCMLLNAFFNQRFVQHAVHFPLAEFESQLTNMQISVEQLYNDNMVQVQGKLSSHPCLGFNPI